MTVASRLPSLNAFIASTMSACGRPARAATDEPSAARPPVPWHAAQLAAMARTPAGVMLGAAKDGGGGAGGGCAATGAAHVAARPAASAAMARWFMAVLPETRVGAARG